MAKTAEGAAAIRCGVGIPLWPMGAEAGCDAQYLLANDILGHTEGRVPRHAAARCAPRPATPALELTGS